MKTLYILVPFLFLLYSATMSCQSLNDYRWTNRIILLGETSTKFNLAKEAYLELSKKANELKERDLLVFFIYNNTLFNEKGELLELKPYLKLHQNFEGVVLIGKDGGIKLKEPFPISTEKLFTLIDGMPMRKSEIQNRKP